MAERDGGGRRADGGRGTGGEPLRVLQLITDLGKGGAERFLLDLCTALKDRPDVEFVIGSLFEQDQYPGYTSDLPVVHLDYQTFSFTGTNEYPVYRALLDDFRPHVIHTHRWLAEFLSGQHVSGEVAYVCHGHDNMVQLARPGPGTLLDRRALLNWLEKRWLIRHKYRKVRTTFVANSTHTLDYYRRVLPRPMRDDVRLVPYGFDYDRFHADELRPPDADGPLRLINVGSFQDKKNQIFIVEIVRRLMDRGVDVRVDLLGDGRNRARVEGAAARQGVADRLVFHGNVDRVEDWLRQSDVYLHTAWYEPFGLVLLEAMAAGLPCVVLDGKGNRDLIEEGRNGWLLEEEDADAFADRIVALARNRETYLEVAHYARDFARRYEMGAATDRFVDLYRELHREVVGG